MINEPEIDWRSFYIQIQSAGISDPVFHWLNFGRLPLTLLEKMLKGIDQRDERLANYHSLATAQLGVLVGGFMGGDFKLDDFIPFAKKDTNKITKETAIAFRKVVKNNLIPDKVVQAFSQYMDDIFLLAGDK